MKITMIGAGYVGLVTAASLAEMGNHVVCLDVDPVKIDRLRRGEIPIHEPGLEALAQRNAAAGRLEFTTETAVATFFRDTVVAAPVTTTPSSWSTSCSRRMSTLDWEAGTATWLRR